MCRDNRLLPFVCILWQQVLLCTFQLRRLIWILFYIPISSLWHVSDWVGLLWSKFHSLWGFYFLLHSVPLMLILHELFKTRCLIIRSDSRNESFMRFWKNFIQNKISNGTYRWGSLIGIGMFMVYRWGKLDIIVIETNWPGSTLLLPDLCDIFTVSILGLIHIWWSGFDTFWIICGL